MMVAQFPVELLANAPLMDSAVTRLVRINVSWSWNECGGVVRVVFGMLLGPERTRVVRVFSWVVITAPDQQQTTGLEAGKCSQHGFGVLVVV
jgi:hypothetical protein